MSEAGPLVEERPRVIVLDADIVVRHVLAEYLRTCGYQVAEAASADEALDLLANAEQPFDVMLADILAPGRLVGFALAAFVRENHPTVDVILAGTPAKAANEAAELCDEGPHLSRPYEPQSVVERIKQLMAARARNR
ncbi:response regulator [Roseixanthobacter glucoisosaccharinicivorans]|uniref:response regulator n=1 Tax=Roseixanthobacter glucoisosaccharinicivorans TaxID=3119923 RepID=UPI00372B070E